MRIVGISCSPRKGRSSFQALSHCLKAAAEQDKTITTELIELAGLDVRGCTSCGDCKTQPSCSLRDDLPPVLAKMMEPTVQGIVIATPVYMGSVTAQCKALLDRTVIYRRNNFCLENKVGGAIAVGNMRNGGQAFAIETIHQVMKIQDMLIATDGNTSYYGATLWNEADRGVEQDKIGMRQARNLGKRVAEFMLRMKGFGDLTGRIERNPGDTINFH